MVVSVRKEGHNMETIKMPRLRHDKDTVMVTYRLARRHKKLQDLIVAEVQKQLDADDIPITSSASYILRIMLLAKAKELGISVPREGGE